MNSATNQTTSQTETTKGKGELRRGQNQGTLR